MARRCDHSVLLADDFIESGGAFVSCLLCPVSLELSVNAVDYYIPFEYTSPDGPDKDKVILVREVLLGNV